MHYIRNDKVCLFNENIIDIPSKNNKLNLLIYKIYA